MRIWLAIALLVSLASPVCAQEEDDHRAAQKLKDQGAAAMRRGDYARALQLFEDAYAKVPSPNLRYNLGVAHAMLGHEAEAQAAFETFLEKVPDAPPEAQRYARQKIAEYEFKRGHLDRAAEHLRAARDLSATPGDRAEIENRLAEVEARIQQGKEEPKPETAGQAAAQPQTGSTGPGFGRRHVAGLTLLGITLASLAASLGTGLAAHDLHGQIASQCTGAICPPSVQSKIDRSQALAVSSDVLLGIGIAAAAGTLVAFILEHRSAKRALTATSNGLKVQF
jgi:tetratricopeptide (TPR) repeat protein